MEGPLRGVRVVELAGMGPAPHAAMMLADLGADVVRVVRPTAPAAEQVGNRHVLRGRRMVVADLKQPEERDAIGRLVDAADVLVEGFRPGVMERLGLGPDECLTRNPRLVYARVTGWGRSGPLAHTAGHDINYIALTGALHAIGPAEHPLPPLNLVGDFGGGSMFLLTGVLAALYERERTGAGQVVDAAMVDGVSVLLQPLLELRAAGLWTDERSANLLDGAAPYYRTYRCSDGRYVAVGCIEPQFYVLLLKGLGVSSENLPDRDDPANWPQLSELLATVFAEQPRDHWARVFDGTDACVVPVLAFEEAPDHPYMAARGSLTRVDGHVVAARAPRLSCRPDAGPPQVEEGPVALPIVLESWNG